MIRSRDLVVFVCIVCFLVLGIGLTLVFKDRVEQLTSLTSFSNSSTSPLTFTAGVDSTSIDREGTIARLRTLLAQTNTISMPSPSVEGTKDAASASTTAGTEQGITTPTVMRCGAVDEGQRIAQNWPLQDTSVTVQNSTRVVVHTVLVESIDTSTASSTEAQPASHSVSTTLLRMPEYPPVLAKPSCVNSEVIGVTQSGFLIFNKDAVSYKGRGQDDLLGYARDGFPIYGTYDGKVDSCGGYSKNGTYRYSIAKERNFVLGCYVGLPLPFEHTVGL